MGSKLTKLLRFQLEIIISGIPPPPLATWGAIFIYFSNEKCLDNFHSCRWGSSLLGLRTRDSQLGHPSTWAEIFPHTCLQSHLQTSPPNPQKSYPKFQNPWTTFEEKKPCPPKSVIVRGRGYGGPDLFFIGILLFLLVRSPCKISKPG